MSCNLWQDKLDTYLDGELATTEAREVEAHLQECSSCSAQALMRSTLKRDVHLAGKKFTADPEFRRRVYADVAPKGRSRRWQWIFAAAGVFALLLAVFSFVGTQRAQRNQLISELTDLHVATLASSNRVDVVSSDRHTVKPWFQGKLPFTFNLPDLQGSSFELLGGRMAYLGQEPGAELLFTVRKHVLSVFIFKDSPEFGRALGSSAAGRKMDFNTASWSDGALRYVIVTDASRQDVDDLRARLVAAAAAQ